jgi:hypothetical protein
MHTVTNLDVEADHYNPSERLQRFDFETRKFAVSFTGSTRRKVWQSALSIVYIFNHYNNKNVSS